MTHGNQSIFTAVAGYLCELHDVECFLTDSYVNVIVKDTSLGQVDNTHTQFMYVSVLS